MWIDTGIPYSPARAVPVPLKLHLAADLSKVWGPPHALLARIGGHERIPLA